jgi:hypothetical protein
LCKRYALGLDLLDLREAASTVYAEEALYLREWAS